MASAARDAATSSAPNSKPLSGFTAFLCRRIQSMPTKYYWIVGILVIVNLRRLFLLWTLASSAVDAL
jgi:hypothetical protein